MNPDPNAVQQENEILKEYQQRRVCRDTGCEHQLFLSDFFGASKFVQFECRKVIKYNTESN